MNAPDYLIVFCSLGLYFYTALLLSLVLTPLSSKIARIIGILDLPDARKVHINTVPRMGGLAMAFSVLLSLVLLIKSTPFFWAFGTGAVVIVNVGLMDDKISISPFMKFAGEITAVLIFILICGIKLTHFGNLFGPGDIRTGPLAMAITIFAMVGFINSLNLSDGLDGLAAGISVIACIFFMPLAFISRQWEVLGVSVILLGVILGFLRYNTYPAKLFMGDSGSLLLGFSLACIAVAMVQENPAGQQIQPITLFWFLSLPVADTLYVMVKRLLDGKSPVRPDKTHLHHRLLALGFTHSMTVTIIYGALFGLGMIGWWLKDRQEWVQFYLLFAVYLVFYTGLFLLEKKAVSFARKTPATRTRVSKRSFRFKLIRWIGKNDQYPPYILALSLVLPVFFLPPVTKPFGLFSAAVAIFVLTLYPWNGGKNDTGMAHSLIFLSLFSLLLLYIFNPNHPLWIHYYLTCLSILSLFWVICRVAYNRRYKVILPTSFELLLIVISWCIPLLWGRMLELDPNIQQNLVIACVLSIPILAGAKMMLRRQVRRNTKLIACLQVAIVLLGVRAFW
ncbi:MAG: undecaprenyl/decaprenyl-phosphate alpha-N-acetylglucosaminyl 1-phosphate transferase [Proteobacteria bacterium]|nr:undecaprenyl/decaprenyl-phosphate alpha-N-acetylglucosaminyl 1-phosphate transferase [Pseudomonadota bacterium]MBU1738858.1 undecaprenyl/decaprenyl-phosphate alpha-N-acetylglucosaminyl 1-phosphate transferase [Pseudomonadota bacterium]